MDVSMHFAQCVSFLKCRGKHALHFSFLGNEKSICKLLQGSIYTV